MKASAGSIAIGLAIRRVGCYTRTITARALAVIGD
jgi:hypothetical protein